jgi:hypothetical protein
MQKTRDNGSIRALYLATMLLIVIVAATLWSEYKAYNLGAWIILCTGGFVFWFIGFAWSGHGGSPGPQVKSERRRLQRVVPYGILSERMLFSALRARDVKRSETI